MLTQPFLMPMFMRMTPPTLPTMKPIAAMARPTEVAPSNPISTHGSDIEYACPGPSSKPSGSERAMAGKRSGIAVAISTATAMSGSRHCSPYWATTAMTLAPIALLDFLPPSSGILSAIAMNDTLSRWYTRSPRNDESSPNKGAA